MREREREREREKRERERERGGGEGGGETSANLGALSRPKNIGKDIKFKMYNESFGCPLLKAINITKYIKQ